MTVFDIPEEEKAPLSKRDLELEKELWMLGTVWYHRIQLGDRFTTPGSYPFMPKANGVPTDLKGKWVLDVGAWDGYWSFECLKRGAAHVVAIDTFETSLGQHINIERKGKWKNFDFCAEKLGYKDSDKLKRYEMSVYDVWKLVLEQGRKFDYILMFGVLQHLRYPLLALDILRMCINDKPGVESGLLIESLVTDKACVYKLKGGYESTCVAEFYPTKELQNDSSNYWGPTLQCVLGMCLASGWKQDCAYLLSHEPKFGWQCLGYVQVVPNREQQGKVPFTHVPENAEFRELVAPELVLAMTTLATQTKPDEKAPTVSPPPLAVVLEEEDEALPPESFSPAPVPDSPVPESFLPRDLLL